MVEPQQEQQPKPVLITIPLSHYCELARWGLEHSGVAYEESAHAPLFHRFAAKSSGGCGSVPVLWLPGGGCVDESVPILRWADERRPAGTPSLFPPSDDPRAAEVDRLLDLFGRRLGSSARVWAYSHCLWEPATGQGLTVTTPVWEQTVYAWGGWRIMRRLMQKGMRITPERGAQALSRIQAIFDEVSELLADGRPFLTGQEITAADLSFAALGAPALMQAYAKASGLSDQTPPAMRAEAEALRATPAGQFALRLWETERHK